MCVQWLQLSFEGITTVKQLNGLDGVMMLGDMFNFPLHIGALFVYDPSTAAPGSFGFDAAKSLLSDIIEHQLPILKCKSQALAFGVDNPYWVTDDNFSLSHHLERVALPKPHDWQQVYALAETFHARPLPMDKPLWEAMYIEGLDGLEGHPEGCVGLLIKLHHAVADGKTAMRLFTSLHTLSANTDAERLIEEMPDQQDHYQQPSFVSRYYRAYWHNLARPLKMTASLTGIVPKLLRSDGKKDAEETVEKTTGGIPATVLNTVPDNERVIGHIGLDSKAVRKLAKKTDATINDIALCVIAGAMREWMLDNDCLPEQSLVAGIPIDTRKENANHEIGNQFNFAFVRLYSQIESPKHRLQAISGAASESKSGSRKLGPKAFLSVIDNIYPALLKWGATRLVENGVLNKLPPIVNTVASNVPGLQAPVYFCGARLVDYIGLGFLAPTMTLFHVISSTEDRINISFVGCPSTLPNHDAYRQALQNSFDALEGDVASNG